MRVNTCLIVLILVNCAFSANILFYFAGGNYSHKTGIWPLVIALANKGHKVTFISSTFKQPEEHPNVIDLAPKGLQELSKKIYTVDRFATRGIFTIAQQYDFYSESIVGVCKITLDEPELQDLFQTGSFDLVIINAVYAECGFLIANHFGAKYIISSSSFITPWFYRIFGSPSEASIIPDIMTILPFPMGIFDRMYNVYLKYSSWYTRDTDFVPRMDAIMKKKFSKDAPSYLEMERNASLVFLNSHHSIDLPRSLPPMFIQIGGMSSWGLAGTLPKEFQEYMDGAEDGVVLITFGSTMDLSTIPLNYRTMFFNTMRKFEKVRFIWRWSAEIPENQPSNLMSSKWLPQKEILTHPKIRAFVTHCGLSGVTEATKYGVPLIAMPFFADQDFMAYRIVAQELGVMLESRGLTQEIMDSAFQDILTNPKYKKNMETKSKVFADRPESPTELAVFWTEFVLRHEDMSGLKPLSMNQSQFTRDLLDVYLIFLLVFVIFPLILLYTLTVLVKRYNK